MEARNVATGTVREEPLTGGGNMPMSVARISGLANLWAETQGDHRVAIAILDGPVDRAHPTLARADLKIVESFAPTAPAVGGPATTHGTQVASLIFGQHEPDNPVWGVAPRCRGVLLPIYGDLPSGSPYNLICSQLDLARALLLAAELGADVINVSGGEFTPSGAAHPILANAIQDCVRRGILIVAAAGNEGCDCLHIPAAVPGVLAVGAMTVVGEPLPSSNWGSQYRRAGLLAPGANLYTAIPPAGISVASGTSFATAIVSGAAGLLLSLARLRRLSNHGQQIRQLLLDTACKCPDDSVQCKLMLAGRLDLARASSLLSTKASFMSDESSPSTATVDSHRGDMAFVPSPAAFSTSAGGMVPAAGCGCESCRAKATAEAGSPAPGNVVFALGQLDFDLVTEARQQSLQQHLWEFRHRKQGISYDPTRLPTAAEANPLDPGQLLEYLEDEENCWDATSVHWILRLQQTAIYAIQPVGPFAQKIYGFLIKTMREQLAHKDQERVEWVSIPGRLIGQVRLQSGQVVPVIMPEPRGMYSWNLLRLAGEAAGKESTVKTHHVSECLDRIYHALRNLGQTSRGRALNYTATNAAQLGSIFEKVLTQKEPMALDEIDAEPSPHCPPGVDCWDVSISFFYPERTNQSARKVFRFAVDVSDLVPVMVGPLWSWSVR